MIKKVLIFSIVAIMTLVFTTNAVYAHDNVESTDTDTQTTETKKYSKGKKQEKKETAEPENAIGKDAAKEKALTDAGLSSDQIKKIKARVSTTEDGTVIYKVGFVFEGQKYSYQIDALTGTIINKSSEEFTRKALKEKPAGKNKETNSDSSSLEPSL